MAPEGCINKKFPLPVYPFPRTTLKPKRYMDKGAHDRSRPRSGVAHFAGVPSKLCIYDNSTTTTTTTATTTTTTSTTSSSTTTTPTIT